MFSFAKTYNITRTIQADGKQHCHIHYDCAFDNKNLEYYGHSPVKAVNNNFSLNLGIAWVVIAEGYSEPCQIS